MATWLPWVNIVGLIVLGAIGWFRDKDVNAAIVAERMDTMQKDIAELHRKASDFGTEQQKNVLAVGQDIAVLKSQMIQVQADFQNLNRYIGKIANGAR